MLVEPGQALATVAAYIDLNPIRANIVDDPADYQWCGYAQAMAGNSLAINGLEIVAKQCGLESEEERERKLEAMRREVGGTGVAQSGLEVIQQGIPPNGVVGSVSRSLSAEAVLARYRLVLYGDAITVETNQDGTPGKRGFSREEVMSVIELGGKVPASQLIRCKVRHFVDGAVVGSKSFVDEQDKPKASILVSASCKPFDLFLAKACLSSLEVTACLLFPVPR